MMGPRSEAEEVAAVEGSRRGEPWKSRSSCERGHPYDDTNTMVRVDSSGRRCRECQRAYGRRWYRERGATLRKARRAAADE